MLEKIKNSPHNTSFDDFIRCIKKFEFYFRKQEGSHQKYKQDGIEEELIVQSQKGKAKAYQIKQFIKLVGKYDL